MRILLDTHALLWWLDGDRRLSRKARAAIGDERNAVFVSAASAWEITTKARLGKLQRCLRDLEIIVRFVLCLPGNEVAFREIHGAVVFGLGQRQIRMRLLNFGFARVERHTHHLHRMVADDETVVTEHTEDWHFAPDHVVALPFVSVQVIESSKISLWRDYSNIDTLLSAAPSWWLQHVTASWAEG